jgi:hypothetical protein
MQFFECINHIPDPRKKRGIRHPFKAVIKLILLGFTCRLGNIIVLVVVKQKKASVVFRDFISCEPAYYFSSHQKCILDPERGNDF